MSDHELTQPFRRTVAKALFTGLAIAGAVGALGGCSSSRAASSDASGATTETASAETLAPPTRVTAASTTVEAIDNDFTPKHLEIKAGTKVTFANTGHNLHDVTAADPSSFDFSVSSDHFAPGSSKSVTFTKPGTYVYYCSLHATASVGSMRGVITVTR